MCASNSTLFQLRVSPKRWTGWMFFLAVAASWQTAEAQQVGDLVVVTVEYDTKIKSEVVGKIYAGTVHLVIDVRGKWCAVQDVPGWLPKRFCLTTKSALAQYGKRIRENQRDVEALVTRSMIYLEQGNLQKAFQDMNESLKIDPKRASSWNNRGLIYMQLNQIDLAMKDIDYALKLAPQYANARNNRGMCAYALGNFTQAINDYDEAIKLNSEYPIFYVNRGVAYLASGNSQKALLDFDAAINIRPNIPEAFIGRSNAFLSVRDLDKAEENASQAIGLDPRSPEGFNNRGWIRYQAKKLVEAEKDFRKAISLNPDFSKAFSNYGVMLTELGRPAEALENLDRAVELDQGSPLVYSNRGNAWLAIGEYEKAKLDFEKAIELAPENAEALNSQAWFLATCPRPEFRNGETAVGLATQANEAAGMKNWSYLDTLAAAYAETEDFEKALELQAKAIQLAPADKQDICQQRLATYQAGKPVRTDTGR